MPNQDEGASFSRRRMTWIPPIVTAVIGYGGSLSNAQYAMAFPDTDPEAVNAHWLTTLSPARLVAAIWCGANALLACGTFSSHYIWVAASQIREETRVLIQTRRNAKRFVTSTLMALLSAVTGGSVSGGPYTGMTKVIFMVAGFTVTGALSFIGVNDLILSLCDKDAAFQKKVLSLLRQVAPRHLPEVNALLAGRPLTAEVLQDFLVRFFDLAEQLQQNGDPLFLEKSIATKAGQGFDLVVASGLATMLAPVYMQAGFSGADIITGGALQALPSAAKIAISVAPGLPPVLFICLAVHGVRDLIVRRYTDGPLKTNTVWWSLFLLINNISAATWLYSASRAMADDPDNLFSLSLEEGFGVFLPYIGYLNSLLVGIYGLLPLVLPPVIDVEHPVLSDAIHSIEQPQPRSFAVAGLREHSFFSVNRQGEEKQGVIIELAEPSRSPDLLG